MPVGPTGQLVGRWIDCGGNDIEFSATETNEDDTITDEQFATHFQLLTPPKEAIK